MNSGIYEIVNTVNGKRYVGSAKDFVNRWSVHRSRLKAGNHHNRHLQSSWNKHGPALFEFRKLLICAPEHLLLYEQIAIDALQPEMNVERIAGNSLGCLRTPETRKKIADKAVGRKRSPESIEKSASKIRGTKHSPERAAKLIGNKHAAGLKHTDEWKAAASARLTGKPRPKTPEWSAKIAATLTGRKLSAEHCANKAAAQTGKKRGPYKPWSEEARANHAAAMAGLTNPMQGRRHSDEARARMSASQQRNAALRKQAKEQEP